MLILITGSFWLYDHMTKQLIESQQVLAARSLVPRILQLHHYRLFITRGELEIGNHSILPDGSDDLRSDESPSGDEPITGDAKKGDTLSNRRRVRFDQMANSQADYYAGSIWSLTNQATEFPVNDVGFEARRIFLDEERNEEDHWVVNAESGKPRMLSYYSAIRLKGFCVQCHRPDGKVESIANLQLKDFSNALNTVDDTVDDTVAADSATKFTPAPAESTAIESAAEISKPPKPTLLSIARIDLSLESVDAQLSRNRAILLATGIVTAFLAMLVAYAIVRYIIVKPVLHLKDVSDEIARGNLNLRAEINTGDEFEELSHAFNRMLRHMMTVNDELRSLNDSLDGKVDQLAQANMELFNNNKLKDDFLATISHELRTPLNSILGFSDILQTTANLDERQKRYVQNIQSSGQSLMVQINDLLDLAKIESGKMDLHLSLMDLADVLEIQAQQIMPLADRKNIDLKTDTQQTPLREMFQDRGKICQIITNLLSNAIKFTPEGGRVRVSSRMIDEKFIEFSVADTGIGIPLQEQEHIFEKFRQGTSDPAGRDHTTREYEGTGLGLSIVRELSRLLGGDVTLTSEFGKGSLFAVRLPLRAPEKKVEPLVPLESRSSTTLSRITSVDLLAIDVSHKTQVDREISIDVQSIGNV
ncbi:MAG: HAMP domain-containing sensor histidine kinase [Planctomycetota bacterium]|nr:HAMP domain-containing sensor histidine kinase [Planctomycetota bacterium]